jgi:hypothetical protein
MTITSAMNTKLCQIVSENRDSLQDEIFLRLNAAGALNSHVLDEDLLRERVAKLVGAFLGSLRDHPDVFVSYVERITAERIEEGVVLHELQLAMVVLEENVWQLVIESVPLPDQVRSLGLVTLIIGTAKDRVAGIYLNHLEMVESEINFLRRCSGLLAQGTDSEAISVSDLNWQRGVVLHHLQPA